MRPLAVRDFLKLFLFTGIGFAHPISAKPDVKEARGIITDPIRSICLIGFNVNLPSYLQIYLPLVYEKTREPKWRKKNGQKHKKAYESII